MYPATQHRAQAVSASRPHAPAAAGSSHAPARSGPPRLCKFSRHGRDRARVPTPRAAQPAQLCARAATHGPHAVAHASELRIIVVSSHGAWLHASLTGQAGWSLRSGAALVHASGCCRAHAAACQAGWSRKMHVCGRMKLRCQFVGDSRSMTAT